MCDVTHLYACHDSSVRATWLIHTRDVTHSHVWHDSFICVTWLTDLQIAKRSESHICVCAWHDSCIRMTWLIHMCDMNHSHVWHNSSTCVTWLIHTCDMTHWITESQNSTYVCVRDMTHSYMWHTCDMTYWLTEGQSSGITYTCAFAWQNSFTCICETWLIDFDIKNLPPPGGFSIYYVPWSRTGRKRTPKLSKEHDKLS